MFVSITVEGQLTGDPALGIAPTGGENGALVSTLQIAVRDRWRDPDGQWLLTDPVLYDVTVPGSAARHVAASLRAGDRVVVHGDQRVKVHLGAHGEPVATHVITAVMIGPSLRYVPARPERHPDLDRPAAPHTAGHVGDCHTARATA